MGFLGIIRAEWSSLVLISLGGHIGWAHGSLMRSALAGSVAMP